MLQLVIMQKNKSIFADDLFGADEQDDFGGDDYARDYYADEDMDDSFEDGDDGGIL